MLALNHYVGCQHGCSYCYARSICERGGKCFSDPRIRPGVVEQVKLEVRKLAGTDKRVLLCFLSDPYQPFDDEHRITHKVIEVLREHDIPFQVLTKGGMRAAKDFDIYGPRDAFAATLTCIDAEMSKRYEPHAALPDDRMHALAVAHDKGIETWASLEPVLDAEQSLSIIDETHSYVDLYKIGVLNYGKPDRPVDWSAFGIAAIERCARYGKRYYIKVDLANYLQGVEYTSEDTRRAAPLRKAEQRLLDVA